MTALRGTPKAHAVRGFSMFGMSFVYTLFDEGTDLYWARARVAEAMGRARLPASVVPQLGPDATGVGWVFSYALTDPSGAHDLSELRQLQDWTVRSALESVPGVAEVAAVMRVSKMTVYRLVHNGDLPAVQVGRSFRIPEQAVHDYLRDSYVETA